jgi:hypothetical protein
VSRRGTLRTSALEKQNIIDKEKFFSNEEGDFILEQKINTGEVSKK